MTKRITAKYKVDRRLGCNLWGRPKSPFNKRNSRPGQHGAVGQRRRKLSVNQIRQAPLQERTD
mgnify:CR=1 FL=1